jgi:lipopolysaccharide/colanic/teichoic acid biosynthesis glycosyltransferase
MSKLLPDESSDAVYFDDGVIGATELKSSPLHTGAHATRPGPRDGQSEGREPNAVSEHSADGNPPRIAAQIATANGRSRTQDGHLADPALRPDVGAAKKNGRGNRESRLKSDLPFRTGQSQPPARRRGAPATVRSTDDAGMPSGWRNAIPVVSTPWTYRVTKRAIDIVGAVVALTVSSPIMLLCAVLIKCCDGGPVFYRQYRVGERGEEFRIYKFRSMVVNADAMKEDLRQQNEHPDDRTFKIFNDPRVTRIGRLMRRLSVDEFPQFWNVLLGQMSLVGPRPALASEVALYQDKDYMRLAVKPGLTCLWQVSGRSRLDFRQQVELDLNYIATRGLWTDFRLILRTFPAVIDGDGAA